MRFEFSAGGIVYKREKTQKKSTARKDAEEIRVLVAQHSQHHGWVFPKGLINEKISNINSALQNQISKRETKEEAALREVREETGILAKIIKELMPVTYWYAFGDEKIKKTVYYFLMEYVSGSIENHDFEMENVEWLPMEEIENRLTYKSDKEVWKKAREKINSV